MPATKITVAEFITKKINESGRAQKAIAEELGYEHPNVISMIKSGNTKLPLDKVGKMAAALHVEPIQLLRLALDEYHPGLYATIETCLANPLLSKGELQLIQSIRRVLNDVDPELFIVGEGKQIVGVVTV